MFGSDRSKKLGRVTRLGYETLETRTLLAASPLYVEPISAEPVAYISAALSPIEEWVQSLHYTQFDLLLPEHVQYLTLEQMSSITHEAYLLKMSDAARAALNAQQVQAINTLAVRVYPLTAQQIGWLTSNQIKQLRWNDFHLLSPAQVPSLTPAQVATIPGASEFGWWTPESRAALTEPQIQALNVREVMIYKLTPQQVGWLTVPQIQSLYFQDFRYLHPHQVPHLTPEQVGTLSHTYYLTLMSPEARAALTPLQVQALDTAVVQIYPLTRRQASWLSTPQIQKLSWQEFHLIHPTRTVVLTPAQIASIPGFEQFSWWSPAARAALRLPQIQALDVTVISLSQLTPLQRTWLTTSQIRSVQFTDFRFLNSSQIQLLTTAQIASIQHAYHLNLIPAYVRTALTPTQVQALNTAAVEIYPLTPRQISWLTPTQIKNLSPYDFRYLPPQHVPHLTTAQMAAVTRTSQIQFMSDEAQAALTRAQLIALPPLIHSQVTRTHLVPPDNYHPAVHSVPGPEGASTHPHALAEAQKAFDLVPHAAATHVVVRSGSWSDPSIWRNGVAPSAGAKVLIPAGYTVDFDAFMTTAIKTLRIDGFLRFATNRNTQLKADTIVVDTKGVLHVGTAENPIQNHVTARILIADGGPIDRSWDPHGISRGVISRGHVRMHGSYVTPYVALAGNARAGDRVLALASIPTNWKVGDELAIAGVNPYLADFGTDRVRILSINGNSVAIEPLLYDHETPAGFGLSIHVANLTRNVQLRAEDASVVLERPHLMLMHNPNVNIENIGVYGFGRTDKSVPINDPVVNNGVLQAGTGTNPRARYAVHFHHTGVNPQYAPAVVRGTVVDGSAGWGFVNHGSHVTMTDNIAINVNGASFVGEDGNEIGTLHRNLAIDTTGVDASAMSRLALHDFGFGGNGFWLQGPGIELVDNIVAGSKNSAYFFMTSSSMVKFDAVNLDNPSHAAGQQVVPVNTAPLKGFERNIAYAADRGLEIWDHLSFMSDARSYVDDFTAWNIRYAGVDVHYSGNFTLRDSLLLGYSDSYGIGVTTNWGTHNLTFENVRTERFGVGIDVPVRGHTIINGGYFSAMQGLFIEKGQTTDRTVTVVGNVTFVRPTYLDPLAGHRFHEIYLSEKVDFNFYRAPIDALFEADEIYVARTGQQPVNLFFVQQLPGMTPFPAETSRGYVPDEYLDKPHWLLQDQFGVAFNGSVIPPGIPIRHEYFAFAVPATN